MEVIYQYISSDLVAGLNLKPQRVERRVIEQMYGTVCKDIELCQVKIKSDAIDDFEIEVQVINAEKPVLTHLPNPRVAEQKINNPRIKRLPVHIIFGAADVLLFFRLFFREFTKFKCPTTRYHLLIIWQVFLADITRALIG